MTNLFIALLLLSITGLAIGLIKPKWIFRWDSEKLTRFGYRKAVGVLFGTLIILSFVLVGVTAPEHKTTDTSTTPLTPEQISRAEELLRQKKTTQKAVEAKSTSQTVEVTEIGCQRLLDELMAVVENKPHTKTVLAQTFMMRKAVDAGLPVKNAPLDLPRFILPESLCGKTLDAYAGVIVEGAKMPSYIIE